MAKLKKCSYRNCRNTSENGNCKFFGFRKHDAHIWIKECQNEKLKSLCIPNLMNNYHVCGTHFVQSDFVRILSPFKTQLKKDAIPTTNLGKYLGTYHPGTYLPSPR